MSVDRFIQLMVEDPELRQRLSDAGSNGERAAMVAEFGIEVPTKDEVTARIAELQAMSDVEGGGGIWIFGFVGSLASAYTATTVAAVA